jgi:ribokinase
VIDTTAAGDAFNGGFAYGLAARGMKRKDAAKFASAVVAISVGPLGAQPSLPTIDEVEALMRVGAESPTITAAAEAQ